ncbi:MAG: hypothetical protein PSV17_01305 [Methylotenera sp.]|uniref:hypothetical protein n=1 Tax=Methylotenera sp. TaxID=2051956 RepID=UPI00248A89A3|nr:hypothetical protein [Methylotenera sp.]MDI1308056.1 hypothetical protein [Methylotenera sp.]
MLRIRNFSLACILLLSSAVSFAHQTTISIGISSNSIGLNIRDYPEFQIIPGYPVYYSPYMQSNYFFYDGMYWVYQGNNWYESSWYDGPWWQVHPDEVPLFILRVPVRYYRMPPPYFIGWQYDAPPRWGAHWGNNWSQHRKGWDKWDHHRVPAPAPLPIYQQNYSGERYPKQIEHQRELRQQNYEFQSNDPLMRKKNDVIQNHRQPNQYSKDPKPSGLEEKYHQQRQGDKQRDEYQQRDEDLRMPSQVQQDRFEDRGQQSRKNGETSIMRSAPKNSQQRDFEYREQNQRQERHEQHEQQDQTIPYDHKQNNKPNPNRQFRDVH